MFMPSLRPVLTAVRVYVGLGTLSVSTYTKVLSPENVTTDSGTVSTFCALSRITLAFAE